MTRDSTTLGFGLCFLRASNHNYGNETKFRGKLQLYLVSGSFRYYWNPQIQSYIYLYRPSSKVIHSKVHFIN